jgi:hypothetical protein
MSDKHWLEKKHWLVAVWPADENGNFTDHHSWRTAILHGDDEEEVMVELAKWVVPSHTTFRIWMMELRPDNAREGTMTVITQFKERS